MNTANTLSNEELIERLNEVGDQKKRVDRIYYDLKKEFDRRLGVDAIMQGQTKLNWEVNTNE